MSENIIKEIFEEYYSQMLFYATRLVGKSDGEDVIQTAFFECWKRMKDEENKEHIKAFLFRTIYTRSLNIIKHRSFSRTYDESGKDIDLKRADYYRPDNDEPIKNMENISLRNNIYAAIEELPAKRREVFKMSYLYDLKNKDIAIILGISLKTVEAHMYKALKYLRKRLKYLTMILSYCVSIFFN
ncbi:MAG: RNA polymerase sigma-70 factor [Bacteroidales bacterium]|jgi:RNA polymerase sigma-70 factor (ECF subfamily)|nr:RNA polymerase sigma-70 factor [Bacteroidales bacterium]